jgi:hypothetical protein
MTAMSRDGVVSAILLWVLTASLFDTGKPRPLQSRLLPTIGHAVEQRFFFLPLGGVAQVARATVS